MPENKGENIAPLNRTGYNTKRAETLLVTASGPDRNPHAGGAGMANCGHYTDSPESFNQEHPDNWKSTGDLVRQAVADATQKREGGK